MKFLPRREVIGVVSRAAMGGSNPSSALLGEALKPRQYPTRSRTLAFMTMGAGRPGWPANFRSTAPSRPLLQAGGEPCFIRAEYRPMDGCHAQRSEVFGRDYLPINVIGCPRADA